MVPQVDIECLVANFHTHPLSESYGGDAEPSLADKQNAYFRGLPGIVISRKGIYSYGPERRENTLGNLKGYPPGIDLPGGIPGSSLEVPKSDNTPPWVVTGKQCPENLTPSFDGTSIAFDSTLVESEAMTDDSDTGDLDVIYVEWSDDGVVYGKDLVEGED